MIDAVNGGGEGSSRAKALMQRSAGINMAHQSEIVNRRLARHL
jgi:hypothetical protein